jgi:hypothetical protein
MPRTAATLFALFAVAAAPAFAGLGVPPSSNSFEGFDLNGFDFDVVTYDTGSQGSGLGGDALASGTSNGIGWTISPTNLWSGRTTTNGSFSFAALGGITTDNLHTSNAFTITFAQPIKTLIVALSNDNTNDSINFGLVPTAMRDVSLNGTQIVLNNAAGGLAMFENINSLTISHTDTNAFDGFDLAFHAVAAVPEPSTYALMFAGLAAVGATARRRAQKQAR